MNKQEILEKVNQALEQIRPFLNDDGGDIELIEVTDDLFVKVRLLGACKSCSMSSMTIKGGVEESIKRVIPELKGVITIEDEIPSLK
jgi:Fe-S cluster biogenesis protein NfuA